MSARYMLMMLDQRKLYPAVSKHLAEFAWCTHGPQFLIIGKIQISEIKPLHGNCRALHLLSSQLEVLIT